MKPALEFFPATSVEWAAVSPGVWERVLARDVDGIGLTRMLRWDPGLDTSAQGPAVHDYIEEVLILSGSMHDLTLELTFKAGDYACRPAGMVHGPWITHDGCEMFEVRQADRGILVGGFERRPITIADYDPGWPARFRRERARILAALPDLAQRVEHIGSTAVPGLAAKPIVDVLLTVPDLEDEPAWVPALERAGYVMRVREPGHRMLRTPAVDVQVHVVAAGDPEAARWLAFRDGLRASAEDRAAYARLKRELARRHVDDVNAYADAKGDFVEGVIARRA